MNATAISTANLDFDIRIKTIRLLTSHEFAQYKHIIHKHESDYWVSCDQLKDDPEMTFVGKATNEIAEAPKGCIFAISPVIEIEARSIRGGEISEEPNLIFTKGEIVSFTDRLWIAIGINTLFCCGNIGYGTFFHEDSDINADDIMNNWLSRLEEASHDTEPRQFVKILPVKSQSDDYKCALCGSTRNTYCIDYGFDSKYYLNQSPYINKSVTKRTDNNMILCHDCKEFFADCLKNPSHGEHYNPLPERG